MKHDQQWFKLYIPLMDGIIEELSVRETKLYMSILYQYWINNCDMNVSDIKEKDIKCFSELSKKVFITLFYEKIKIKFLDEQFEEIMSEKK